MQESLRDRLVAVGAQLVAEQGTGALSLREIARRAGVSHGAPRRYFPTHHALLVAIAGEGYRELGSVLAGLAADESTPPPARILALADAFVVFAGTHRGMFELMFRHDLLTGGQAGLREESLPLFRLLVDLVAKARGDGPDATVIAGALWANVFGIVQLWQWRSLQLATGIDDITPLLRAAVTAHLGRR